MNRACLLFALAACATEPADDIHYTGETRRFVIDQIAVPTVNNDARAFGADLDGDKSVDNQLGMVTATLNNLAGDITKHGPDMIASGMIASSVELVADDFDNDDTVALRYFGADGDEAQLVGGTLTNGTFENTRERGAGAVHLPVFVDADPVILPLVQMRAHLTSDGHGGFDATIQGAVPDDVGKRAAYDSLMQMFASYPSDHVAFFRMLDTQPNDFNVTFDEFKSNNLIESLLAPDITIDGTKMLSIGFKVHLSACANGNCALASPVNACFDRVQDGSETEVDCGGSCRACETNATCFDGVRNGLETDVDCGSECGPCATGEACWSGSDCSSGTCGQPCSGIFCGTYTLDVCR